MYNGQKIRIRTEMLLRTEISYFLFSLLGIYFSLASKLFITNFHAKQY